MPRHAHKRLLIGSWFAALSILSTALLHSSWATEMALAGIPGGSFSFCMASGGSDGNVTSEKDGSTDRAAEVCDFCVIPNGFPVPASHAAAAEVGFQEVTPVRYGGEPSWRVFREPGFKFDARAPPA